MPRVTLKDIGDKLGLSASTVSLALRRDARIPARTVEKVAEAAAALGYIYNKAAADLRKQRSDTVAVCLGDLSNPFFNDILVQVERDLHQRGKRMLLGVSREDVGRQTDFIRQALEMGADGIVLCPAYGSTAADLNPLLWRAGSPLLPSALFFRQIEGFHGPQVVADEYLSGALSAGAAVAAGHRRFAWLGGGHQTSSARLREAGARARLSETGLVLESCAYGPTSRAFGYEAARAILEQGDPKGLAFLCFSDLVALGVLSACQSLGVVPGKDVSVIGCDDMDEVKYSIPPLSTVSINVAGVVGPALDAVLHGGAGSYLKVPPHFMARASIITQSDAG